VITPAVPTPALLTSSAVPNLNLGNGGLCHLTSGNSSNGTLTLSSCNSLGISVLIPSGVLPKS